MPLHLHMLEPVDVDPWLRQLSAQKARAIAEVEDALTILDRLRGQPGFARVDDLDREYRRVLDDLKAIDPANPPSSEEVSLIAVRLRLLERGVALMAKTPTTGSTAP